MESTKTKTMTGYPSIDKPWLKYYSDEAVETPLPDITMYQYIYENNKNHLNDTALRYYGKKISYGKLFEKIISAAAGFSQMGIKKGDIVTIMSVHTPENIISIYALNYIGAVANLVYMSMSKKELIEIISNTDSKLLIILDVALEKIGDIQKEINIPITKINVSDSMPLFKRSLYNLKNRYSCCSCIEFNELIRKGVKTEAALLEQNTGGESDAVIVYTSGTTGSPKGCVLTNKNLNAVAYNYLNSGFNFHQREKYLDMLPTFIGFGVGITHLILSSGFDITLCINLKTADVAEMFVKVKPNHFITGPSFIEPIMVAVKGKMQYLVNIGCGGESLPLEKEKYINEFLSSRCSIAKCVTGYGMTETSSSVCTGMNHAYKAGSLGIPLPKNNMKIIDTENGQELKYNEEGEICFSSPSIMRGYYKNQIATNEMIFYDEKGNRWIHTGDIGCVDEDGFLYFSGRIKRIYTTKDASGTAYKIFPQRIEELIESHNSIRRCGVVVKDDLKRLHVPIAFVTVKTDIDDIERIVDELFKLCRDKLPEHMLPADINVIDNMPLTESGKINYKVLEKMTKK